MKDAAQRLHGNRATSAQSSRSLRKLSTEIGALTASVQRLYDFFSNISTENRTIIARPPYDARAEIVLFQYDVSTGYRLRIFKNKYNFFLNKIEEAAEHVNPYDNRTTVATSARRPYGNGITDNLRPT